MSWNQEEQDKTPPHNPMHPTARDGRKLDPLLGSFQRILRMREYPIIRMVSFQKGGHNGHRV
jgi:hypothetical protein